MTEDKILKIKEILSTGEDGNLRKLFYKKNGLPKMGLYTNKEIFGKLNIDISNINSLEYEGINCIIRKSLTSLRKQAKDNALPWVDIEIAIDGHRVARHGYSHDIALIMKNADKYDSRAESLLLIAQVTRGIAKTQEKLLVN